MIKIFFLGLLVLPLMGHPQLIIEKGAGLYLSTSSVVVVQGDFFSQSDIEGEGMVILKGTALQTIDFSSHRLSGLLVENPSNVRLSSAIRIDKELLLREGRLQIGVNDLHLSEECIVQGDSLSYLETTNEGRVVKFIQRDQAGIFIPLGTSQSYTPLVLTSRGPYRNAYIAMKAVSNASPNKPLINKDFLENFWVIKRNGIEGHLGATAFYRKVAGAENNIRPYYWNGRSWVQKGETVDPRNKFIYMDVPDGIGELYAMNNVNALETAENSMAVSPNPVTSVATLTIRSASTEKIRLRVVDSKGVVVLEQQAVLFKGINRVHVNLRSMVNGYYNISSTQENVKSIPIVKHAL